MSGYLLTDAARNAEDAIEQARSAAQQADGGGVMIDTATEKYPMNAAIEVATDAIKAAEDAARKLMLAMDHAYYNDVARHLVAGYTTMLGEMRLSLGMTRHDVLNHEITQVQIRAGARKGGGE